MTENNPLIQVSMNIILNAGDARNAAFRAIEFAKKHDFAEAEKQIEVAELAIKEAHTAQTEVIQNEMAGENYELCILFIHAQDTLMTIKSELNLAKEIIDLHKAVAGTK